MTEDNKTVLLNKIYYLRAAISKANNLEELKRAMVELARILETLLLDT
jgi:hypothetical protein